MHAHPPEITRDIRFTFPGESIQHGPFDPGVAQRLAQAGSVRFLIAGRDAKEAFRVWWHGLKPEGII